MGVFCSKFADLIQKLLICLILAIVSVVILLNTVMVESFLIKIELTTNNFGKGKLSKISSTSVQQLLMKSQSKEDMYDQITGPAKWISK